MERLMTARNRQPLCVSVLIVAATLLVPVASPQSAQTLHGKTGKSPQWGSGWIDLATTTSFSSGDRLLLHVGGTAGKVLVGLLSKGSPPDDQDGIVGGYARSRLHGLLKFNLIQTGAKSFRSRYMATRTLGTMTFPGTGPRPLMPWSSSVRRPLARNKERRWHRKPCLRS